MHATGAPLHHVALGFLQTEKALHCNMPRNLQGTSHNRCAPVSYNKAPWLPYLQYVSSLSGLEDKQAEALFAEWCSRACPPENEPILATGFFLPLCISDKTWLAASASSCFMFFVLLSPLCTAFCARIPDPQHPQHLYCGPTIDMFTSWSLAMCPFIFSLTPALSGSRRQM